MFAIAALGLAVAGTLAAVAAEDEAPPAGVVKPLAPRTNPTTDAKVALGAALFTDRRLSIDGDLACATCHLTSLALTDGRPVPIGRRGKKLARNAPTLLNVGLVRDLFHDGRSPTLEEQARAVILNDDELGWPDGFAFAEHLAEIEEYGPLFEEAFGSPAITLQRTVRALAAFERTLLSGDAPFDRWWAGDKSAMEPPAVRGYGLFIGDGGCVQCHSIRQSYALFSDGRFHNTGAGKGAGKSDPGRAAITGIDEDTGAFRTPTLRNVALTGPYMHDGSLATLAEVVEFYVDGGVANPHLSSLIRPLAIDDAGQADLVAFLQALTSPVLPRLEDCDRLLAEGRPREAFEAFAEELGRLPASAAALTGVARAALALDEREPLVRAEGLLRERIVALSPARSNDADPVVARHLVLLGDVSAALSDKEDALAVARAEDAILAYRRARRAAGADRAIRDEALLGEARWLEIRGRRNEAVVEVTARARMADAPRAVRLALAGLEFRRGFQGYATGIADETDADDLRAAGTRLDTLHAEEPLVGNEILYRAYARHYLDEADAARARYLDAIPDPVAAERALSGLRNLLARDLETFAELIEGLLAETPDSPALLYHVGFERLRTGDVDGAATAFRRRIEVEPEKTAWPRVFLARAVGAQGDRDAATRLYVEAMRIRPDLVAVVRETEDHIRARPLTGFASVDALIHDYETFLAARPDHVRFQVLSRNNLAFLLREVVASHTSRGPARLHTFPAGTPDEARTLLARCTALYEEAVARIPDDVENLPFSERWVYAGVLNDTGLMHHYFAGAQDFERAEALYLRAFRLTGGAYQDAYFYNLQFLYAFELTGRESVWLELAEIAKDSILREDPESESGFSTDPFKRRAAQRDWERLAAARGR